MFVSSMIGSLERFPTLAFPTLSSPDDIIEDYYVVQLLSAVGDSIGRHGRGIDLCS